MKRSALLLVVAIACILSSSCQSLPSDMIVGRWQLDSLSIKPGAVMMDSDSFDFYENNDHLLKSNLAFHFHENKTLITTQDGYEERGSYTLRENPQSLSFEFHGESKMVHVVSLTEDDLVFSMDEPEIAYVVFHLKRVK